MKENIKYMKLQLPGKKGLYRPSRVTTKFQLHQNCDIASKSWKNVCDVLCERNIIEYVWLNYYFKKVQSLKYRPTHMGLPHKSMTEAVTL